MLELRLGQERGSADHGWLNSRHTFSFADYYDPEQIGFGVLRVINEDRVQPGTGFGMHGHSDMEIISYVLEGELEHKDSMGNGSIIRPGDVQRMSAGRGVLHSERNPSGTNPVHFLQIWIKPNVHGRAPSYEQKFFAPEEKRGCLRLILSEDGANGSVRIQQDARLYAGLFDGSERATLRLEPDRSAYVHVARGRISVDGKALSAGDGLKVTDARALEFSQGAGAEVLVFDLPKL
jgi:quercetin 2,3-dioxygenase